MDEKKLDKEIEQATNENTEASFVHKLKKPVEYNGKLVEELSFNFDDLTGADLMDIEDELTSLGKLTIVPATNGQYLIRMCAKACTEKVGSDLFLLMNAYDHNRIKSAARSFLLRSE